MDANKEEKAGGGAASGAAGGAAAAGAEEGAPGAGAGASTPTLQPEKVVVHPLVLLSVVDHYNRDAKDTNKRVVGVLLGTWSGKTLDVTNTFGVPFEEDENDPSIWYFDHNFLENMWDMFRKISAKEKVVGWYHSGPKLRSSDLAINELVKRYAHNSVLVVVDVRPADLGLPTNAYYAVDEIKDDGTQATKTFNHVPTEIRAAEAEEIGVEHLLRDVKDNAAGSLSTRITDQVNGLRGLQTRLLDIHSYLEKVVAGQLPVNHEIIQNLQDIFNLLPNLNLHSLVTAFSVNANDQLMVLYLASLVRAVIALHNLINNKLTNRDAERELDGEKPKDAAKDAGKDGAKEPSKDKDKDKESASEKADAKSSDRSPGKKKK